MLAACAGIVGIFLVVQLGALALVEPFQEQGHQVVEDTSDPTISIIYIGAILAMTVLVLAAIRFGGQFIIRALIIFAGAYIGLYVFQVIIPTYVTVDALGYNVDIIAWLGAVTIAGALYLYPEWYVIDATGIVMGIGAAGLFGVNFGILPALVLLTALAVYDAISVYGTEHMLTLASGVMEMRVPVVLVVPVTLSYSFLDDSKPETVETEESVPEGDDAELVGDNENGDQTANTETDAIPENPDAAILNELGPEGVADLDTGELRLDDETRSELDEEVREALEEKRDALFIGLGDAVIPTVLVASAAFFIETGPTVSLLGVQATLPAVTAMVGTLIGLVVLLWMVLKGRAHAGLPLLNGGAIAGYLLGALVSGLTLVEMLGLSSFV